MFDENGDYIGPENTDVSSGDTGGWSDNGDGTFTGPGGEIIDSYGNTIGNVNDTLPLDTTPVDTTPPEVTVPANWIDNQDGTVTDPATGDVWGIDGSFLGNTADAGLGGGSVVLDPDEFGDVYTVNGKWIGNLYGLSAPGTVTTPTPGTRGAGNNAPGGAYSGSGLGGSSSGSQNSAASIAKQLQQMLASAKTSGASFNQQAAIASALRNAQAAASPGMSSWLPLAAVVAIGAFVALRRN